MRKSLAAIIAVSVAVQLWLAWRYYGFLTGDDVEVLSEAFRRARGLAYTPWDIRNLFVPDVVVAPVVFLSRGVSVRTTIFFASLPFIALSSLTIWLVYRLALRWCDEQAAIVAALLFATHWIPLSFGSTVYPRTLAAACVVAAALIVERRPFVAGVLIGIAFADRFSEIVFLAPLLGTAALRGFEEISVYRIVDASSAHREFREALECGGERATALGVRGDGAHATTQQESRVTSDHDSSALPKRGLARHRTPKCFARNERSRAVGMTVALLAGCLVSILITVGVYDWITWGAPFSSAIKFAHLTLVAPDFASRVKYQAPWWYLANIVRWCSPALLPLLWYARRSRVIWFIVIPLIAFSAIKHKELRYLQVIIPFLCIAAAIGFASMRNRRIAIALVVISIVWNMQGLRYLARKSQPSVMAARWIASNPSIRSIAASQLWSYGDKLYLGDKMAMSEVGTPPEKLSEVNADAVGLYETDLDVPSRADALRANGYAPVRTFRDDPARPVVVFMKRRR